MTDKNLYAVYDTKAKLYSMPHTLDTDGVAIRSFSVACEDETTQFYKHPEDFSLYHLGSLNIETGALTQDQPKQLANASEFVKNQ